jgi:hypothetical protein
MQNDHHLIPVAVTKKREIRKEATEESIVLHTISSNDSVSLGWLCALLPLSGSFLRE